MSAYEGHANRLIDEKSPYLLQHAYDPVEWYPWCDEAFDKAKRENKPVFLSIGYSTCHWCHVMKEESFTDPEIAKILNTHFVSVKVDREERPDIDTIYMKVVMALTGSGGWPLTVFLTPEKMPFFGGTYFPPEDRWGRPGLKGLLTSVTDSWANRRKEITDSSASITGAVKKYMAEISKETIALNENILKKAFEQLQTDFDAEFGGFGPEPKFPSGHSISFLLRYWKRSGDPKALYMAEKTLTAMASGGIYDHIGAGFHRYATDRRWHVPHFEKMLYDQALLSKAYIEAYQETGKEEYARIARETFAYIMRDMEHAEGGFYSAEDADSAEVPDDRQKKREGAFYVWRKPEVMDLLGKERGEIVSYCFGIEDGGNVVLDTHGGFEDRNILFMAHNTQEAADRFKRTPQEIDAILKESKETLFKGRAQRPRPHLDDKVLTDWNGLMISSLALGSRVLDEPRYRQAAEKAARFVLTSLVDKNGRLLRRYRDGEAAINGTIDDYAFFIQGLIDLYEATFDIEYITQAQRLADDMLRLFWDDAEGGFFFTADDAEELMVRNKEFYDTSVPSGNSVASLDLVRLSSITARKAFREKAEALFTAFSSGISQNPSAYLKMLAAFDFALGPSREIVIAGEPDAEETNKMVELIYRDFMPNKVVLFRPASKEAAEAAVDIMPFLKDLRPLGGKTAIYICENYTCRMPTTDIAKAEELMAE